jgi:hypothetical protein
MFEDTYGPPFYTDLYAFQDGAQDDIFTDSYVTPLPVPGPSQTELPQRAPPLAHPAVATTDDEPTPTKTSVMIATSTATTEAGTLIGTVKTPTRTNPWCVFFFPLRPHLIAQTVSATSPCSLAVCVEMFLSVSVPATDDNVFTTSQHISRSGHPSYVTSNQKDERQQVLLFSS